MLWYNLLPSKQMPCKKNEEENEELGAQSKQPRLDPVDLVSPHWEALMCAGGTADVCRGHSPCWLPASQERSFSA